MRDFYGSFCANDPSTLLQFIELRDRSCSVIFLVRLSTTQSSDIMELSKDIIDLSSNKIRFILDQNLAAISDWDWACSRMRIACIASLQRLPGKPSPAPLLEQSSSRNTTFAMNSPYKNPMCLNGALTNGMSSRSDYSSVKTIIRADSRQECRK